MLGTLTDGSLAIEELHRFPNTPVRVLSGLHWDVLRLFHEVCRARQPVRQAEQASGRQRKRYVPRKTHGREIEDRRLCRCAGTPQFRQVEFQRGQANPQRSRAISN